jgi:hypothetical protein
MRYEGYKKLELWVLEDNKQARDFYEKFGFRIDGTVCVINAEKELNELRYIIIFEKTIFLNGMTTIICIVTYLRLECQRKIIETEPVERKLSEQTCPWQLGAAHDCRKDTTFLRNKLAQN